MHKFFKPSDSCKRSLIQVSQFRENYLNQNVKTSSESEICQKMIAHFRVRNLSLHQDDVPYRVLSHWDSLGLLECERENGSGWRRFNLIERLWIQVIIELRKLGLSLEKINSIKPYFFEKIDTASWLAYAEYYGLSVYLFKRPTYFLIFEDSQSEFLDWIELKKLQDNIVLEHFITLNLNKLFSDILKKPLEVFHPSEKKLTVSIANDSNPLIVDHKNENSLRKQISRSIEKSNIKDQRYPEICDLLDFEDFDFLKIIKQQNHIKGYEYQKSFSPLTPESEIKKNYKDYEISEKFVNGKVSSRTRTVRKKI